MTIDLDKMARFFHTARGFVELKPGEEDPGHDLLEGVPEGCRLETDHELATRLEAEAMKR